MLTAAPPRPRCSVFIAASLDGFIARADDSLDWLAVVQAESEDYGYAAFVETVDAFVLGRRTYETALGFDTWPYGGKRCVVLSRSVRQPRHGEEIVRESPEELLNRLGREGLRRVYIDGGALIRSFFAARLVDDVTVSVVPVLLGGGIALFGEGVGEHRLVLERTLPFPSGLVQLRYRVAREPEPPPAQ